MALETRFNEAKADHVVSFFEKLLVHTKGSYARQPFLLSPFQRDEIIRPLFGTQMFDPELDEWVRLYNAAWLEMGRKNGKSEVLAGVALYMTGADDEEGAEVYGVAKDTDQASLVFDVARRMLELSGLGGSPRAGLPYSIYPTNKRITYPKTGSFYRVIASDALGNLGQNPHAIVFDEVVAQPNGELWDAMKTGYGTRAQPLMLAATTAGDDTSDFAKTEHDFSERVLRDPTLDPRRFVFMRNLDREADWTDESRWGEANPALGDFLRLRVLQDEMTSARNNPREERRFRMFRLNQWQTGGLEGWVGAEAWGEAGNVGIVPEEKLAGQRCWGGVVAASATDIAAVAWVFQDPEGDGTAAWALWRAFIPEARLNDLNRRTSGKAAAWAKPGGPLIVTEGDQLDIDGIVARIQADSDVFDVQEFGHFAGNALGIAQPLVATGLPVVSIGSNTPGSALVDWERMLRAGQFNHGGNPIASWQVAHVMARETVGGTARFDMKGSKENIYLIVAAELALRRYIVGVAVRSAYEDRGMMTV